MMSAAMCINLITTILLLWKNYLKNIKVKLQPLLPNQLNWMNRKMIFLASLGLLIPILLVAIAFVAIKSDAENKRKYEQIQQEQLKQIEQREALEAK